MLVPVVGLTVVDALNIVVARLDATPKIEQMFQEKFSFLANGRRLMLVTGHRRESFGGGFERICQALVMIAETFPDLDLNPNRLSRASQSQGQRTGEQVTVGGSKHPSPGASWLFAICILHEAGLYHPH